MPTLNWIGKDAVVRHHQEVPFRLLEPVPELSCDAVRVEPGEAQSGNLIVQGDNLHALKALLPRYAGQVKCIYIDPPYNTGNEGWAYNDNAYAPTRDYDGRFGNFKFRRHFHGRIGDFDSKEEFDCACWLDTQAQQGRIRFWVRNLVRREGSSFFLQKADGRFYPDFVCQLADADGKPGAVLVVEYKGADRWTDARDDRLIGGLWAELSQGRCRFVMVKDRRWEWIDAQLP